MTISKCKLAPLVFAMVSAFVIAGAGAGAAKPPFLKPGFNAAAKAPSIKPRFNSAANRPAPLKPKFNGTASGKAQALAPSFNGAAGRRIAPPQSVRRGSAGGRSGTASLGLAGPRFRLGGF